MKKRIFIYITILLIFVFGVFIKQRMVMQERNRSIVSNYSVWERKGKPVVVEEIAKEDVRVYSQITITPMKGKYFCAYVPKTIQEKLRTGQLIFPDRTGGKPIGKVVKVSENIDYDTGLFLVKVKLQVENLNNNSPTVVYINTKVLKEVVHLPRDTVDLENGNYFVWIVDNEKAKKIPVTIGRRGDFGVIIKKGLKGSEKVIFRGFTNLYDGDKVNFVDRSYADEVKDYSKGERL